MLKMGFKTNISQAQLKNLKRTSHFLDDLLGHQRNDFAPYVGKYAFAHKGGLHVSAVAKNPQCYEHVDPDKLGNQRYIIVSDQAGRSNIINRLKDININVDDPKNIAKIAKLVDKVKDLESKGYSFDVADASFAILANKLMFNQKDFFEIIDFSTTNYVENISENEIINKSEASIKIKINNKIVKAKAKGIGPVNALDQALRKILVEQYSSISEIKLSDYKVRIINPSDGTKAITRVLIEFSDDHDNKWSTIGVSDNIVYASFQALKDAITYKLMQYESK